MLTLQVPQQKSMTMRGRLGPYEILAPLGAGGMGEVYRARDTRLDRMVAIKVLTAPSSVRPEARLRFEREARAIAALNHPHICALHDIGSEDGVDFLVMQYLEGQTLAARLAKGRLTVDEAMRYAIDIAEAIDAAHRRGITHRDLKPSNVMLTRTGAVLLDFGLAKLRDSGGSSLADRSTTELTRAGVIIGTVRYMAPEVLDGKEADARSDLFSFGAVAYEMLTGRRAFEGDTEARVIASILSEDPPPIASLTPEVPVDVQSAIETCLKKDPDERWQDARDLVRQLHWIAEGRLRTPTPGSLRAVRPVRWPAVRISRRAVRWIAVAGVLAIAIAGGSAVLWRTPPAALPAPPHFVALPCNTSAAGTDARAFCDGLTEAVVSKLARLTRSHRLQVTPHVGGVNRTILTTDDARRQLGATWVLQAGVQPVGDGYRVNYTITVPRTRFAHAAQMFELDVRELFEAHERILAWVVRALSLELTHPQRESLMVHDTRNAHAQWAFFAGRGHLLRARDPTLADAAVDAFDRAIANDVMFAAAHAALGMAWRARYLRTRDADSLDRARRACAESVRLQPKLAEGHTCLGMLSHATGD